MLSHIAETKKRPVIKVSVKRIAELIGIPVQQKSVANILMRLSFRVLRLTNDTLRVTPPLFRQDVTLEEDVAEEVARLVGYSKIPPTMPKVSISLPVIDDVFRFSSKVREELYSLGYSEVYTDSFYGASSLLQASLPEREHRIVVNPLSSQQEYLRADVLPNLFDILKTQRKRLPSIKIFEIGQVFWKQMRPGEHEWRLGMAVSFQDHGAFIELQRDFASCLARVFHIDDREIHLGAGTTTRDVKIGTNPVGIITLRPIKKGVSGAFFECSLTELMSHSKPASFDAQPKFPAVYRDIAILVSQGTDSFTLLRQLYHGSSLITRAELFDVTPQGQGLSYAFHLTFQSKTQTLDSRTIDVEMTTLARVLQQKGG
jgi:phenylalanyl-tRNA synthetase beta chain